MSIAASLRMALAKKNKSQTWLAKEIEVTRPYVCNICNGNKKPSIETIERICKALEITKSDFFKYGE